ncbi:MAG: heparinase II/III family protein, partial [Tepidisphaeraceae bacterium]
VDFLYEESPEPAPLPLETFPLAHHAAGIGKVYARSDWTDAATWFRFECGDLWNGHQHYETGNFEIFRYEPLATESGEYADYTSSHAVNWLIRTVAHNCILVNQPDEKWNRQRDGGRNTYANDGGQDRRAEWFAPDLPTWLKQRDQWKRGKIVAYENRPEFLFVAGDCTKAYAPSKLGLCMRQIVFLRPGTFVIFDRVISTKAEYEKTWLLHSRFEPKFDGLSATIENGKGKLIVRTLLPEAAKIDKIEGYTYGGQTFNEVKNAQSDTANRWRIEVKPPAPRTEDVFLHVLFTEQPQETKLMREGESIGVQVGPATVMFTGRVGGELRPNGQKVPLQAKVVRGKYE